MTYSRYVNAPTDAVLYGTGSLAGLPVELDRLGARRVFLVSTPSVRATPLHDDVVALLGDRCVGAFADSVEHLPVGVADELLAVALRTEPDAVVTLGGGTVTDAGKLVALAIAAKLESTADLDRLPRYGSGGHDTTFDGIDAYPPVVAIPTTLSAAEYTGGLAVVRDGVKTGYLDYRNTPKVVILDPAQTAHTPERLWASTGIRALDHAVESFISRHVSPVSDATAVQAARRLFQSLAPSTTDPLATDDRLSCLIAAWLSNFAFHNTAAGLSHAIGHQLGARYGVGHGVTSCISLPAVTRLLAARVTSRTAEFGRLVGLAGPAVPDAEAADALVRGIVDLVASLPVPSRIREVGVARSTLEADLPELVHKILTGTSARYSAIDATEGDLRDILLAAW